MDSLRDKVEERQRITGNWGQQLPKTFVILFPNGLGERETY